LTTTARKAETALETAGEWVSLPTAARELGVTRSTVLTEVVKGNLVADNRADFTFIERKSLEALKAIRKSKKGGRK